MRTIVIYYSRKGSNKYLAEKLASSLDCNLEAIRPRINVFFLYLMNINFGIHPIKSQLLEYDKVILAGPIWMGRFIPPLKSFVRRYKPFIKELAFITCCGSTDAQKEEKFGHGLVFKKVEALIGDTLSYCRAFPIDLVLPEEQKGDSSAFMETHLNDTNFKGEIAERFEEVILQLS